MKFSVLMSLYKKEQPQFLEECLDSLKNQTLQASEIILVFDGVLTEGLENVVANFTRLLPIRIIRLQDNVGLGKALNEGLKHCSNEWIFRMDTDDICCPNRFEKQERFIKENPNVVLFSSHIAEFTDSVEQITGYRKVPIGNEGIGKYALKRSPFNHMTVVFKKIVILEVEGYQHHMFLEDYNLWLRVLARKYEVGNVDEVLLFARAGTSMVGRRRGRVYAKSEWKLFKLKKKLKLQGSLEGFGIFLLRVLPRFLPTKLLEMLYKKILR